MNFKSEPIFRDVRTAYCQKYFHNNDTVKVSKAVCHLEVLCTVEKVCIIVMAEPVSNDGGTLKPKKI